MDDKSRNQNQRQDVGNENIGSNVGNDLGGNLGSGTDRNQPQQGIGGQQDVSTGSGNVGTNENTGNIGGDTGNTDNSSRKGSGY